MINYEIIPSPGTENKAFSEVEQKISLVRPFTKTIHIDIVDGKFAPHKTLMDPALFAPYTKDILFEIHLMVEDPIHYLKPWADAGFQRFIGQVEKMSDQIEFVAQAQLLGEVALALDKHTPVDNLKVSMEDLDALLIMTIQAGRSGQQFEETLLEKVKQLRERTDLPIEVDGGINDETIELAAAAGANRFVVTSFLFNNVQDPKAQWQFLKKKLDMLAAADLS
jgi:ribulose-phosphate 3-epimerase